MKTHKMKLRSKYFQCMLNGTKQIEIRLNDEKRRDIKLGDEIVFEEVVENPRYLKTKVIDLYYEDNFEDLLNKFDVKIFADEETTKEDLLDVLSKFYSAEEQMKYGVVGIKIEII